MLGLLLALALHLPPVADALRAHAINHDPVFDALDVLIDPEVNL